MLTIVHLDPPAFYREINWNLTIAIHSTKQVITNYFVRFLMRFIAMVMDYCLAPPL